RFQRLKQLLSPVESMRAERFHFEQDRKRFIACHGILRMICGRYLNVDPRRLRFCNGKNGKPTLANEFDNRSIHFNLSHSHGIALYGYTRDQQIGVDIEHIHDISEMGQIAQRFFSKTENEIFRSLPESKKKEAFFHCWTRKEAFIKAIGDGLSYPLHKFDVSLIPGEPAKLLRIEGDSKRASRWSVQDLKPAPGFVAAFAIEGGRQRLRCWQWLP
ncbi:4'-phosphopantetheinyl transferase superfamily protein, partial [bacterium]|nr:4'-phosphopantetheinyl transferase superfamily protein [bacterium]